MNTPLRFNIRVYGICIRNSRLLVNEEIIRGQRVIKFPGGGLELGEGVIVGLKREFVEELNLEVEVTGHFYTTDFYQPSAYDNSQVISLYYNVSLPDPCALINTDPAERSYWLPLAEVNRDTFTLPIDKVVGGMITANGVRNS